MECSKKQKNDKFKNLYDNRFCRDRINWMFAAKPKLDVSSENRKKTKSTRVAHDVGEVKDQGVDDEPLMEISPLDTNNNKTSTGGQGHEIGEPKHRAADQGQSSEIRPLNINVVNTKAPTGGKGRLKKKREKASAPAKELPEAKEPPEATSDNKLTTSTRLSKFLAAIALDSPAVECMSVSSDSNKKKRFNPFSSDSDIEIYDESGPRPSKKKNIRITRQWFQMKHKPSKCVKINTDVPDEVVISSSNQNQCVPQHNKKPSITISSDASWWSYTDSSSKGEVYEETFDQPITSHPYNSGKRPGSDWPPIQPSRKKLTSEDDGHSREEHAQEIKNKELAVGIISSISNYTDFETAVHLKGHSSFEIKKREQQDELNFVKLKQLTIKELMERIARCQITELRLQHELDRRRKSEASLDEDGDDANKLGELDEGELASMGYGMDSLMKVEQWLSTSSVVQRCNVKPCPPSPVPPPDMLKYSKPTNCTQNRDTSPTIHQSHWDSHRARAITEHCGLNTARQIRPISSRGKTNTVWRGSNTDHCPPITEQRGPNLHLGKTDTVCRGSNTDHCPPITEQRGPNLLLGKRNTVCRGSNTDHCPPITERLKPKLICREGALPRREYPNHRGPNIIQLGTFFRRRECPNHRSPNIIQHGTLSARHRPNILRRGSKTHQGGSKTHQGGSKTHQGGSSTDQPRPKRLCSEEFPLKPRKYFL